MDKFMNYSSQIDTIIEEFALNGMNYIIYIIAPFNFSGEYNSPFGKASIIPKKTRKDTITIIGENKSGNKVFKNIKVEVRKDD